MAVLVLSVILVLVIWAICSFTEAALYAVSMPFVRQLRQTNPDAGKLLTDFKENIERPISAVLERTIPAKGATKVVDSRLRCACSTFHCSRNREAFCCSILACCTLIVSSASATDCLRWLTTSLRTSTCCWVAA